MPALTITDSDNISILDSKIVASLCAGNFVIDLSPSVFMSGGTSTSGGVQGASVRITNPVGVLFKNYPTSGYDIYPPMTSGVEVDIPLIASNYQYGTYTIDVRLTDHDGNVYTVTKTVNICPPDSKNKTKKQGCLNASIKGDCRDGKVRIVLDQAPTYKGTIATSQVNDLELEYPTASGLPVLETTYGSFSVVLFEGEYKLTGTTCVLYPYIDNVSFKVQYKISCSKIIKCVIDDCCIQDNLDALYYMLTTDCSDEERTKTESKIVEVLTLVQLAKGAALCGADPSSFISQLEKLLGCICTCNCNEGTPIINNDPVIDYVIEGCNVEVDTVGLTKTYTINNYGYRVELAEGSDAGLMLSEPVLNAEECEYVQTLNYAAPNIPIPPEPTPLSYVYRGLLSQTGTSAPTVIGLDGANTRTINWIRVSAGVYRGTVSGGGLTAAKTFGLAQATITNCKMSIVYESATTVLVTSTAIDAGAAQDGLMSNTPIQLSILT